MRKCEYEKYEKICCEDSSSFQKDPNRASRWREKRLQFLNLHQLLIEQKYWKCKRPIPIPSFETCFAMRIASGLDMKEYEGLQKGDWMIVRNLAVIHGERL